MEELWYWIIEYGKVLVAYGFLMFVWPSVVFRKYLKEKSVTLRFGFCVTVQVVLVSTVVLLLGMVHLLNKWTMWIFFYGVFLWSIRDKLKVTKEMRTKFKYLITGTFGGKHLLLLMRKWLGRTAKRMGQRLWSFYRKHCLEYTLLIAIILYGMLYFSWGAFQESSYGFSDIYVHHNWIYQLSQGKPFSAGIYPEGMHCVIYALYALFGVRIYSCLLFIGGVNIIAIILSIYCLAKEFFHWRYSSIFALLILFTINMTCMNQITAMARLQCALPQEFGFPALYLCGVFLLRFLKQGKHMNWKGKESKGCFDENLLVFCMALAATIVVHFYTTIMAFFLCLGIAIICLRKIFTREHFLPLVTAAACGVLLAATPMVVGFISGIPLQGSLYWGMSIIQGSSDTEESVEGMVPDMEVSNTTISGEAPIQTIQPTEPEVQIGQAAAISSPEEKPSFLEKVVSKGKGMITILKEKGAVLYQSGYRVLFQEQRSQWIVGISVLVLVLWCLYRIIGGFLYRVLKWEGIPREGFDGYPMIVISAVLFVAVYAATALGLPSLIEGSRTCFIGYSLVAMTIVIVLDMVFSLLACFSPKGILHLVSLAVTLGIVVLIYGTGNYHGYLYYELSRYEAAVNVTNGIIESLPENTYTIVSPTDELYQVIEYGRHEEWLTFLQNQGKEKYLLPTEYVFLFIEKKPLEYVQWHFFGGPKWLASDAYAKLTTNSSEASEYLTAEISQEDADKGFMYFGNLSGSYTNLESRTIIESKAYRWYTRFKELYPFDVNTYYEDEYFVCYYFRQNTQSLYNLAID